MKAANGDWLRPGRKGWTLLIAGCFCLGAAWAFAQQPIHYFQDARLPLGAVGRGQLMRFQRMRGYPQPVEFLAPRGVRIAAAAGSGFEPPRPAPYKVGLQVGHVYRFQVTSIPLHPGEELYPTVEVINRLHPPAGREWRFPVPIELTQEELEFALDGRYVTRVIYLEDPAMALPVRQQGTQQRYFEAARGRDPLRVADELGRPMAILRIGSRVPVSGDPTFLLSSPPVLHAPPEPNRPRTPRAQGTLSQPAPRRQPTRQPARTGPPTPARRLPAGAPGVRAAQGIQPSGQALPSGLETGLPRRVPRLPLVPRTYPSPRAGMQPFVGGAPR